MILANNKRALRGYDLHERYEAGISLLGWEVKGILAGQAQLLDSYVSIHRGEAWLVNCHIAPQANVNLASGADPKRRRKLLLRAAELRKIDGKHRRTGMTIMVVDLRKAGRKIKAVIALAKGRKLHDKRRKIEERDWRRNKGW
ncbi:MAG: SsrA-binding protein SmpB [Betaproteobacteria bacterium AqS2]|uniref:SsrA-binding protein n=1 Tax=Candidatus Amphirhobacter heronislandensis TaxID=1732024 RepID=A0A930XXI2_9GAMM|nr:SsrA-binding protein SmpB [Betaproteobacteria bacterium AqS2]